MSEQNSITSQKAKNLEIAKVTFSDSVARFIGKETQLKTEIPSLSIYRSEAPIEPVSYMLPPSLCLIAQGAKRLLLGEEEYVYDANHFLVTSVDLPVVAQIIEASVDKPYLGLTLELDQRAIAQLMVDTNLPLPRTRNANRGIVVSELSLPLLNAFQRLIDLLDEPEDIPILAPLAQREILYRLLVGEQGPRLRQIATAGNHSHQIARAIDWLKGNYNQSLRVDNLADQAGMSASTFHHHFREVTAMSPLQFQKKLRLNEARRLMLTERIDAATAAFEVGYESPSQFSREYSRMFGAPPLRDIKNLHQSSASGAV